VVRLPWLRPALEDPFSVVEYEARLYLVFAIAFAAGLLLAVLLFIPSWILRTWERGKEHRALRGLEGELIDLRNLPVTSPAPLEDVPDEPLSAGAAGAPSEEDEEHALLAAALQDTGEGGARGR